MRRPVRGAAVAALLVPPLLAACGTIDDPLPTPPFDRAAYEADTRAWRQKRLDAIAGPDGWATLAGLVFLDSGAYTVGSAPGSGILLPAGHAPAHVGSLSVRGELVTFTPAPGAEVWRDSGRVRAPLALLDDRPGPPTVLRTGSVTLRVLERAGRRALRVKDSLAPSRTAFKGFTYFPVDSSWRVAARLRPHDSPRTLKVINVLGMPEEFESPGMLEFHIGGKAYSLIAARERGDTNYFVIFRDSTSLTSTYPAGRFMHAIPVRDDHTTVLDFNRAFNPPCAFTTFATCPLPPPENALAVSIPAGEQRYAGELGAVDPVAAHKAPGAP
ncbi:MAG: DUF1684 domain-containing protein [Gemmatimonadales bacterium]|nr:DUF1684 domain-containing protein [Gemmatimonadales bacterium]